MLGHNLESIQPDGTILPANGEQSRPDEPGHVALALGEFYRATGETTLKGHDIVDLAARCITAQMFTEPPAENGLAYASLGLLCFGPSKERNPVWERLVDETRSLYITRRRLIAELAAPASSLAPRDRVLRELRLQEIEAQLDGLADEPLFTSRRSPKEDQ
jgi:hypothetical protein